MDNSSDYGSIQWATPVSSLLRDDFVLSDPWATEHITVADALSHRTGYPRHDFSGPYHNSSAAMVRALRHLPMSAEPRARWQYNNMMYATVGHLVETLANSTLADFLRDRLWRPMGMRGTYLHPDDALAAGAGRLARPYYWDNDTETYGAIPWRDETSIAGAGMAISSVLDWSRYVRHMVAGDGPHLRGRARRAQAGEHGRGAGGPPVCRAGVVRLRLAGGRLPERARVVALGAGGQHDVPDADSAES